MHGFATVTAGETLTFRAGVYPFNTLPDLIDQNNFEINFEANLNL